MRKTLKARVVREIASTREYIRVDLWGDGRWLEWERFPVVSWERYVSVSLMSFLRELQKAGYEIRFDL